VPEPKHTLEKVTMVLFNPVFKMRTTLRQAMIGMGFRDILDFGDIDSTRKAIMDRNPDIVLLDLDRERDAVCKLVREVRHSQVCADPFVVMMALSWHPSIESVNNSLEAGVDDILTMPLSIKAITTRINELIHNRKHFVVTQTYVGPDRRSPSRRESQPNDVVGTIQVPNNLRYKTTGDETAAASGDAVSAIQDIKTTIEEVSQIANSISSAVEEQGAATQEIVRNVQEASKGTQDVTENISGVTQAAQETGTAAQDLLNASDELSRQGSQLHSEIDGFMRKIGAA
jgi:DNA-binding response OmpR family regulator